MAINKVVYGDQTLVDLTQDSVSAENLLEGETAHDRSGNPVTGTAKQGHIVQNNSGTDMTQRAKVQFVGVYTEDDSTNNRTKVNIVREMTKEQMDALSSDEKKGFIRTTNEPDTPYSNISDAEVTFTEASERTNIASGEKISTLFGKIKKWFTDLPSMFVSKSGDTMSGTLTLGTSAVRGELRIIGNDKIHYGRFYNTSGAPLSDNRNYNLPDKGGTLALLNDMSIVSTKSGTGYEVRFVSIGDLKFIYLSLNGLTCTAIGQNVLTVDCPSGFSFSVTKRGVAVGDYSNQSGRIAADIDINYSSSKINFACYPVINNQYVGNLGTSIFLYGNVFVMI